MKQFKDKSVARALRGIAATVFFFAGITSADAQIQFDGGYYCSPISKKFSSTGKPQIVFDNGEGMANIYDDNLNFIKQISYTRKAVPRKVVTEKRLIIPGEYTDITVESWTVPVTRLEEAKEIAYSYGAESHTKSGNVHTFLPIELPEQGEYIKYVYVEGETEMTVYTMYRSPKYSDWQVTDVETSTESYYGNDDYYMYNYDEEIVNDDASFNITQTLFNNDDKYEYLSPVYELGDIPSYVNESDYVYIYNEDFPTTRESTYYGEVVRTDVKSEDGNVVYTIPDDVDRFIVLGGKTYCVVEESMNDGGYKYIFYLIDRQSNSIKAVQEQTSNVKISPRMAGHGEMITVETGEDMVGQQREVVVTAMDGRVINRVVVPAGETVTRISTSRMGSGTYNFTVLSNGKKLENGKIIIR